MTQRAISLPFSFDSSGGVAYTTDERKIWQDRVVIVVMTGLKERVMRPGFGTNTKKTVFENTNDAISIIKQEVTSGFAEWLKPLSLTNVLGSVDSDGTLNIEVQYKLGVSTQTESVKIKTALLSRSGDTILEIPNG